MESCYVALNFASDLWESGIVGTIPEALLNSCPCIPSIHDHIFFPEQLSHKDGRPAAFVIINRWFVSLPGGIQRCELELALLKDVKIPHW